MKKSKKLMLGTIAAMGALAVGAGAVSTFAWFKTTDNAVQAITNKTGQLTVDDNSDSLGDVYVKVTWGAVDDDVNYTDKDGNSYYYAGTVGESYKVDVTSSAKKTGTAAFTVSLAKNSDGTGTPTTPELQAVAGTHVLTFTAEGEVKIGANAAAAIAVESAGSTVTHSITIASSGITAGASGSVVFGFMGTNTEQSGSATNKIAFTSVS